MSFGGQDQQDNKQNNFKNNFGEFPTGGAGKRFRDRSPFNKSSRFNNCGGEDNKKDFNFEELKKELDKERNMFFGGDVDDSFGFPSAAQSGFPFDEVRGQGRSRLVDDFASRHPMFAQHLRRQPWEDAAGFGGNQNQQRERNNSGGAASTTSATSGSSSGSTGGSTSTGEHIIPIRVIDKQEDQRQKSPAPAQQQQQEKMGNHQQKMKNNNVEESNDKQKKYAQRNTTEIPIRTQSESMETQDRGQRAQSCPPGSNESNQNNNQLMTIIALPEVPEQISIDQQQQKQDTNNMQNQQPKVNQFGASSSKEENQPDNSQQQPQQQNSGIAGIRRIPIRVEGRQTPFVYNHSNNDRDDSSPTPPASKKPAPPLNPMERINQVSNDVKEIEKDVVAFTGNSRDKRYLFIDEMLTRNLLKLDDIDTNGLEEVRQARKDCIKLIQHCISMLEAKVDGQNMDTENTCTTVALVGQEENNADNNDQDSNKAMDVENGINQNSSSNSTNTEVTKNKDSLKEPAGGKVGKKKNKSPSPTKK